MKLIDEETSKLRQQIDTISGLPEYKLDSIEKLVKEAMINYALAAMMDSSVREEIDEIIDAQKT